MVSYKYGMDQKLIYYSMGNAWGINIIFNLYQLFGVNRRVPGFWQKKTYLHRGLPANQGFNRREAVEKHGPQVSPSPRNDRFEYLLFTNIQRVQWRVGGGLPGSLDSFIGFLGGWLWDSLGWERSNMKYPKRWTSRCFNSTSRWFKYI